MGEAKSELSVESASVTNFELLHAIINAIESGETDINAMTALEEMKRIALSYNLLIQGDKGC